MTESLDANPLGGALAAGDPAAFAALYDQAAGRMFGAARLMLHDRQAAEDAVQEVFVTLVQGRDRISRVRDLEAYLFVCLRNAISRSAGRRNAEQRHVQQMAAARSVGEPKVEDRQEELDTALQVLPAAQREMIALKIDGDLTFAQIAEVLGISPNTAASRYRYALEKLRDQLKDL